MQNHRLSVKSWIWYGKKILQFQWGLRNFMKACSASYASSRWQWFRPFAFASGSRPNSPASSLFLCFLSFPWVALSSLGSSLLFRFLSSPLIPLFPHYTSSYLLHFSPTQQFVPRAWRRRQCTSTTTTLIEDGSGQSHLRVDLCFLWTSRMLSFGNGEGQVFFWSSNALVLWG